MVSVGERVNMISRWLTARQAAEYCGYNVAHFRRLAKEYKIPRYGPGKNRYDRLELDEWMRNPEYFLPTRVPTVRRRHPGQFTPVKI